MHEACAKNMCMSVSVGMRARALKKYMLTYEERAQIIATCVRVAYKECTLI